MGPVSGTGRAMMASLQQAMQQGMPVDQAIAYVKGMAQQGVAPLVDLYAMLNQFQRLQQPQAQAPQTPPTVRDQINMAAQQQAMQQAQQQAMMQGLGGMNAGAMENPQFAGGGIIAFQDGGFLQNLGQAFGAQSMAAPVNPMAREVSLAGVPTETIVLEFEKALLAGDAERANTLDIVLRRTEEGRELAAGVRSKVRQQKEAASTAAARERALSFVRGDKPATATVSPAAPSADQPPATPPPAPPRRTMVPAATAAAPTAQAQPAQPSLRDFVGQVRGLREEAGIGKSIDEGLRMLQAEEAEYKSQAARDRSMALAEAGFRMMEAASRPGATFMESLGAFGQQYTKGLKDLNTSSREYQRSMLRERLNLNRAKELVAAGDIESGISLYKDAIDQQEKAKDRASREATALFTARLDQEGRLAAIASQDRATYSRLLGDAGTAYASGLEALAVDPTYLKAKPEVQAARRNELENAVYKRMTSTWDQISGREVREDLPYGAVLKFNPQTGRVE